MRGRRGISVIRAWDAYTVFVQQKFSTGIGVETHRELFPQAHVHVSGQVSLTILRLTKIIKIYYLLISILEILLGIN